MVLAIPLTAFSEPSVSIFGTIGLSVAVQKSKGRDTVVEISDGVTGGGGWGVSGSEVLGNGISVGFYLDNGFSSSTGETGEKGLAWSNQASLSISGAFGEFSVGRMGGLASYQGNYSIWNASPMGTDYAQASLANVFYTDQPYLNNTIYYGTPEFSGLRLYAMYSNGTGQDDHKWSRNAHYFGLGTTYEVGAWQLAGTVERYDHKGSSDMKPSWVYSLSIVRELGTLKVNFGYQYASRFHGFNQLTGWNFLGDGLSQNAFSLGMSIPVWGGHLKAMSGFAFGKIESSVITSETGENQRLNSNRFNRFNLGMAYEYPLSKRTMVYTWAAAQKGGKALKTENVRSEFQNWSVGCGMTHSF